MRKTIILVSLFLTVGALSGCTGDGTEPDSVDTGTDGTDQTNTDSNETLGEAPPAGNVLPVPTLEASNVTGTLPITVQFTMDGADPDGMFFQWTLDADGDGTTDIEGEELPATFEFTFDAAGDHTAVFNLSNGEDSAEATLDLTFAAPPVQPVPDAIVFAGTITGIDDQTFFVTGEPNYVGGSITPSRSTMSR